MIYNVHQSDSPPVASRELNTNLLRWNFISSVLDSLGRDKPGKVSGSHGIYEVEQAQIRVHFTLDTALRELTALFRMLVENKCRT